MSFLGTEVMRFNDNCETINSNEALLRRSFLESECACICWSDNIAKELEQLAKLALQGEETAYTEQGKVLVIENIDLHELDDKALIKRTNEVEACIKKIISTKDFEAVAYLALTGIPF